MRCKPTILTPFCVAAVLLAGAARAEVTVRDPGGFIVDEAGIVDAATERKLSAVLADLEQKTGAQVKVLTVQTTDGESVFQFTQRHAELWKLGQPGKDNGVLIVVAVAERETRIHPGYGLESILPDSWCGSTARSVMAPRFRRGDYAGGIVNGALAVAKEIADAANVTLTGAAPRGSRPRGPVACGAGLAPLIILFILLGAGSRRGRHGRRWGGGLGRAMLWGLLFSQMSRGGRMRGGGFGGGGFGGGFGGGSFGGGGGFGGAGGGARW